MLRAFWSRHSANDRWIFDKSVWQKMFRTMGGCGMNAIVLAIEDPFSLLMGSDADSAEYEDIHHWVIENARDYEIAPYLAVPAGDQPEQTFGQVRDVLETYTELAGIYVKVTDPDLVQRGIIDAVDAVRPDATIYLRGWTGDPRSLIDAVQRRGSHRIAYVAPFTGSYLVDESPDPSFTAWIDAAGAENVIAEIAAANIQPWTSFSYDTADGILSNLQELGCEGFALQPLSRSEWPHTSDTHFKYQWQRDLVWYSVWGGTNARQLAREGQPKWLARNQRLVPGFQAGSRIVELLALYFGGDKQGSWLLQFCSVCSQNIMRLLTIEDMLNLQDLPEFSARDWWTEITGDQVVHLAEYVKSGTPEDAYGPEELIEDLMDLSEQAVGAGEKGMRSASGEKELPSFSRDAYCMGRLGEFYVERIRAALTHARGDDSEAAEHLARALDLYRQVADVDSSHRESPPWPGVVKSLEAELADASAGSFRPGAQYVL